MKHSKEIRYSNIHLKLGQKQIFNGFNLTINAGEKILLNAPSGSGKSSLVRLLLGFQKPDSGKIFLDDKALEKNTRHSIRSQCCYVSQDVDLPEQNVWSLLEHIFSFKVNHGHDLNKEDVITSFKSLDLDAEILEKNVKNLSGGERQRLGLSICFLLDRPVWLLDEVTSGLDPALKESVRNIIINSPKTVIIISHDEIWDHENIRKVRWD